MRSSALLNDLTLCYITRFDDRILAATTTQLATTRHHILQENRPAGTAQRTFGALNSPLHHARRDCGLNRPRLQANFATSSRRSRMQPALHSGHRLIAQSAVDADSCGTTRRCSETLFARSHAAAAAQGEQSACREQSDCAGLGN